MVILLNWIRYSGSTNKRTRRITNSQSKTMSVIYNRNGPMFTTGNFSSLNTVLRKMTIINIANSGYLIKINAPTSPRTLITTN